MTETSALPLPVRRGLACPFDPAEEFADLRASEPVTRTTLPSGEPAWVITRHADIRRVFGDPRTFSNIAAGQGPMPPRRPPDGVFPPPQPGFFVAYDPPEHTRLRRLLAGEFTARRLARWQPRIDRLVGDHLDALEAAGPPADLVHRFALPVPTLVICELLGVPVADRPEFERRGALLFDLTTSPGAQAANFVEMNDYMTGLVASARRDPGDNVLGSVVRAAGDDVSDDELAGMCSLLLVAGSETTAHMISLGTLALLRHDDQRARLARHPELIDTAVEELLRYLTVVHYGFVLTAVGDTVVGGRLIRAGDYVMCALPSGNRDSALLADADRFDITRPPVAHLAFGHGVHYCIGAVLARMELRTAYPALLGRFPALRLAVGFEEVELVRSTAVYGVRALPVTW